MKDLREKVIDTLFELLRFEMNGELFRDEKIVVEPDVLPLLFNFSKKHDLAHLIGDALDKNGFLPENSEAKKRFLNERNLAVMRYEQKRYEFTQICTVLENAKIPFMPLKGAVIQDLYPEAWMRTSCDIDVLVKKQELNRAISLLTDNLGYNCKSIGQHDAQIFSPTGVHIELHFSLQEAETEKTAGKYLDSVWERVSPTDYFTKVMPDEFLYTYIISHMIKHVKFGGCGIRAIMDIHLLSKSIDLEKTRGPLKRCGFLPFAEAVENLASAWFGDGQKSELSTRLEEYILTGGVYGSFDNKISARQSRQKTKLGYFLRRLFIPFGELKQKYQILHKCAILYPFCLVARWFSAIFNKETKARISKEVKKSNEVANSDNGIGRLIKDLEI